MARPKPNILLENLDKKTYKAEQILEADAVYAVFYQGKAINLRSLNKLVSYPGPKYKKVSFANKGSAFNLADKLNAMFQTDEFEVFMLVKGDKIVEHEQDS
jgi:hypothetical protein